MAYCTQANIELAYPLVKLAELTNGTNGLVDVPTLDAAIEWADDQIDQACEALYGPLPFSAPVPTSVKWWSIDLTLFRLGLSNSQLDPNIALQGDRILEKLDRIAGGDALIPGLSPGRNSTRRSPDMVPVFSMGRRDADGNVVGTPETGTLDKY